MDRELIERLAKEAGLAEFGGGTESNIERFAALIAEECAQAAEREASDPPADTIDGTHGFMDGAEAAAFAIRTKFGR